MLFSSLLAGFNCLLLIAINLKLCPLVFFLKLLDDYLSLNHCCHCNREPMHQLFGKNILLLTGKSML